MRVKFLLLAVISACLAAGEWKVNDADRTVDLTTQILKTTTIITYENIGAKEQNSVLFAVPLEESEHISYFVAREDAQKGKLKYTKKNTEKDFQLFQIELSKAVAKGSQIKLKIEYRLTDFLTAHPVAVAQSKPQFIKTKLNTHVGAAYPVAKEKTTIKVQDKFLEGKSSYGPFNNQPAFASEIAELHYECNFPFVVATVVERKIELSHWGGNIAVEEYIELENKGAKLKGTFSRLDHTSDRRGQGQRHHLQHFTTVLPAAAKDIYYRDEIGNISTSSVRVKQNSVELTITPRFPLFGGWRTSYVIGYNVPSYEYLSNSGNNYALKMRVLDHILDNVVVEKLTTKIILPEFSRNVKVNTPYTMDRRPDEIIPSYLDREGRFVVTLKKDNLVSDHIQSFSISYDFDSMKLLQEPLLACGFYFLIFLFVIVYVRFDFSLSSDPAAKAAEKLSNLTTQLQSHSLRKDRLYKKFVEEVTAFKENRDESALNEAKRTLETERVAVHQDISDMIALMKEEFSDAAEKAGELLVNDKSLFGSLEQYIKTQLNSKSKSCPEDSKFKEKIADAAKSAERILGSLHAH